ncbi:hypothetical protein PRK78_007197 [Emydomyces testavorans]|uniref:Mucin n=1 Tax=Emydomyces testavorans TaxID=2070801 RepID=A0AAF0DMV3_9EURO|nr:hypothetical protein PRK78_007197 [Emydomyces testavorans]
MFHTLPRPPQLPFPNLPARKQRPPQLENFVNAVTSTTNLRYGLSTPPEDMTDLAVNPSFPVSHGAHAFNFRGPLHADVSNLPMAALTSESKVITQGSRQQQPPSLTSQLPESEPKPVKESAIAIYLQVPSSICENGGSLADFAAQITCLFWFANASKLKQIEDGASSPYYSTLPLDPESMPSIGFRKWMITILSTTQVSRNVVLLALLFIYRLKKFNPSVRGKRGILDDNTYTNKTWTEVSGISIKEIHVMEVEFLSNVRYNLFVTKEEWERWHSKLRIFANYFDRASRLPLDISTPRTPTLQISPSLTPISASPVARCQSRVSTLPSPPAATTSSGASQPRHLPLVRPSLMAEASAGHRKRSWDEQVEEYPEKRLARPNSWTQPPSHPLYTHVPPQGPTPAYSALAGMSNRPVPQSNVSVTRPPVPQLPTPALTISTNSAQSNSSSFATQLPLPVSRALSTVYTPVTTWAQSAVTPTSMVPPPINLPSVPAITCLNDRSSPYQINSTNISPALSAYSTHTPTRLSPTSILNRNSPYRPVRAVNTLLYPPPPTSFQQPRQFPLDMMHYRPLGKSITERKTGVLPYYPQPDGWTEQPLAPLHPVTPNFK